jgi:ribosomal protein S18 acetylase RimI-like enzyme
MWAVSSHLLPFVRDLMAKNYEAVGFLPATRLEEYLARGQVLIQRENDEPCGYLAFGNGWPTLKVYQCCIQYDARRLAHATQLVSRLISIAEARGCSSISLWCADDLDANSFWRSAGFTFSGQRSGGARRGRRHNCWVMWLRSSLLVTLDAA